MIEWFTNAFSADADKARLATILISTLVGMSIFLFNQYFNRRKARRDLMIQKIEEACGNLLDFEEHSMDALSSTFAYLTEGEETAKKSLGDAITSLKKVQLVSGLYLKDVEFDRIKYYIMLSDGIQKIREAVDDGNRSEAYTIYEKSCSLIEAKTRSFEAECKNIMTDYRH